MKTAAFALSVMVLVIGVNRIGASEPALVRTMDDAEIQWGPGPDILPKGSQIAVLHGNPAQPNADIFLKLPGKSIVPMHWHTSAERMVLVSGKMRVSYQGQETKTLKPGTYAYGPAKLPHSAECVSSKPCVLFIAFETSVDAVPGGN